MSSFTIEHQINRICIAKPCIDNAEKYELHVKHTSSNSPGDLQTNTILLIFRDKAQFLRQESISPTFYLQFLCMQILEKQKRLIA